MIATDHAPHTPEEKTRNDIWTRRLRFSRRRDADAADADRGGSRARSTINDYVRWSAANPAKVWGLYPRKGALQPGADADIAIVDLGAQLDASTTPSCSRARKISPWHGRRVTRRCRSTRWCAAAS